MALEGAQEPELVESTIKDGGLHLSLSIINRETERRELGQVERDHGSRKKYFYSPTWLWHQMDQQEQQRSKKRKIES